MLLSVIIVLLVALVAIAVAERVVPQFARDSTPQGRRRRMTNRLLSTLNALMVIAGMGALAWLVQQVNGGGVVSIGGSRGLQLVLHMLLLDFAVYWSHRLLHTIPSLWALHQIHHSDAELDVTSIGRGHPLEVAIGFVCVTPVMLVFNVPVMDAVLYQVWLNLVFLFAHANVALPVRLERFLAVFIQTPNLHAVHHRPNRADADSMYGLTLTLWDRLLGTYNPAMREGAEPLGVAGYEPGEGASYSLRQLLLWPWKNPKDK